MNHKLFLDIEEPPRYPDTRSDLRKVRVHVTRSWIKPIQRYSSVNTVIHQTMGEVSQLLYISVCIDFDFKHILSKSIIL